MDFVDCIGRLSRSIHIVIVLLSYFSLARGQLCYAPNALILANYGICHPDQKSSLCCAVGDRCYTNDLCQAADNTFYRGGCTPKGYSQHAIGCPLFCTLSRLYLPLPCDIAGLTWLSRTSSILPTRCYSKLRWCCISSRPMQQYKFSLVLL